MKDQKLVILIILLIKRKMLKLCKNTFKTMLAFLLIFIHFLVIFSLFRGKTTFQAKYYYKLFSFQQDDPPKRRSCQRPQYSGKKCDLFTPENTWTALKNSSGHVCDPRCEEVLILEEIRRKDKIQQEFNPHIALMPRPGPLPHVGAVLQAQLFFDSFFGFPLQNNLLTRK